MAGGIGDSGQGAEGRERTTEDGRRMTGGRGQGAGSGVGGHGETVYGWTGGICKMLFGHAGKSATIGCRLFFTISSKRKSVKIRMV